MITVFAYTRESTRYTTTHKTHDLRPRAFRATDCILLRVRSVPIESDSVPYKGGHSRGVPAVCGMCCTFAHASIALSYSFFFFARTLTRKNRTGATNVETFVIFLPSTNLAKEAVVVRWNETDRGEFWHFALRPWCVTRERAVWKSFSRCYAAGA